MSNNAPASGHEKKPESGDKYNEYYISPSIFQLGMDALRRESEAEPKVPGVASSLDFSVQGRNIGMNTSRSVSALEIIEQHKPQATRRRWDQGFRPILPVSNSQEPRESSENKILG